jgi:hypothetical protein
VATERYHYNPCLLGRHPRLVRLGDWLATLTPECPCCAAVRMLLAAGVALVLGVIIGAVLW